MRYPQKIILFFTVLIIIIGGIWSILANKFETAVRAHYASLVQRKLVIIHPHNLVIKKYYFKVLAKNITIFPGSSEFIASFDEAALFYNFFNNTVSLKTFGKKLSSGSGDFETYIPNPSLFLNFTASLFDGKFDDFTIHLQLGPTTILKAKDDSLLYSFLASKSKIVGHLNEDIQQYSIKIENSVKGISYQEAYSKWLQTLVENINHKMDKLLPELNISSNNMAMTKPSLIVAPYNSEFNIQLDLNVQHFKNFFNVYKGLMKTDDVLSDFNIDKEIFTAAYNGSTGNASYTKNFDFNLSGDKKNIIGNLDYSFRQLDSNKNLSSSITTELIVGIINEINKTLNLKIQRLTQEDYQTINSAIADIHNSDVNFHVVYEIPNSKIKATLYSGINKHFIDMVVNGQNDVFYNLDVKLSDPHKLIEVLVKFANDTFLPMIGRSSSQNQDNYLTMKKIVSNIEKNGYKALGAFNKKPMLNQGDIFELYFIFNINEGELKINDKSFNQILSDERINDFIAGFYNG